MSLIPAFEIGVWNAWIITVLLVLTGMVPGFLSVRRERIRWGNGHQDAEATPAFPQAEVTVMTVVPEHTF